MFDCYNRKINYLRISITDRCNLRCKYCMPSEGITLLPHDDIITFEEIVEVIHESVALGIDKIRLTGGEPLVRKGVEKLVQLISEIKGVLDFGLTTNGIFLEEFAEPLAKAGLHRINISLDTVNPLKFAEITRGGDLGKVFKGIQAAQKAGLNPVKINCVIKHSSLEPDALEVKEFCLQNGLEARFIHEMDLERGCFTVVEGGQGGNCRTCNRLRLTANGKLKPCLFDNLEFDIRELGIRRAILDAVQMKPEQGSSNMLNKFHNIGG